MDAKKCILFTAVTALLVAAVVVGSLLVVRSNDVGGSNTNGRGGGNNVLTTNGRITVTPMPTMPPTASPTTTTPSVVPTFPPYSSPEGVYTNAAVAADNGLCSEIGRNIMFEGGNAVDAIIAVDLCIGIMDPHSAGTGGGFFMTFYNSTTHTCHVVDAREEAPGAASENMYANESSTTSYLAIAVPGDLHGLRTAHDHFGSLEWSRLFQPAIQLARYGHPVSGALGAEIDDQADTIMNEPSLKEIFFNDETGQLYKTGEIMYRTKLADTLEALANSDDPVKLFYDGEIGQNIVAEIQAGGGIMTTDDLKNYKAIVRKSIIYANFTGDLVMCGPPPPSSAAIVGSIIGVLEGYDISPTTMDTVNDSVRFYHRFIESMKFGYAARSELGDEDFVANASEIAHNITTKAHFDYIASKITDHAHPTSYYGGKYMPPDHGTSHMCTLDHNGNAASLTSTINLIFGSKRRSRTTGIILNDEMDDFSSPNKSNYFGFAPSKANFIKPGKRPQSSMSPIVVFNAQTGKVRLVTGTAGGSRIISTTASTFLCNVWLGESIKFAIDVPRLHDQLYPNVTQYEIGFPQEYVDLLTTQYGQDMVLRKGIMSEATGIAVEDDGNIYANSDRRKGGSYPAGY